MSFFSHEGHATCREAVSIFFPLVPQSRFTASTSFVLNCCPFCDVWAERAFESTHAPWQDAQERREKPRNVVSVKAALQCGQFMLKENKPQSEIKTMIDANQGDFTKR